MSRKAGLDRCSLVCLLVCMHHRWITIGVTVAAFALALFGMKFVQQQFFPSSDRDELVIDWNLPQNASIAETNAQMARFEREQLQGNAGVDHWSTYVGTGAPRFVLSFDVQTANTWFGQMVVVTKGGIEARDRVKAQFETYLRKTFPGTDTFVKLLEVGPPVGRPVQYRVSGPDIAKVRELSQRLAGIVRANPHLDNVVFDWMEPARVVKVDVLQDKARQLGVSSEDIATTLNGVLDGTSITQVRDSIYLVNVMGRATAPERASIDTLRDLQLDRPGRSIGAARGRRHTALRNRAADNLAAVAASHDHAQGKHPRHRAAEDGRGPTRAEGGRSSQRDCRPDIRSRSEAPSRRAPRARLRSRPSFR